MGVLGSRVFTTFTGWKNVDTNNSNIRQLAEYYRSFGIKWAWINCACKLNHSQFRNVNFRNTNQDEKQFTVHLASEFPDEIGGLKPASTKLMLRFSVSRLIGFTLSFFPVNNALRVNFFILTFIEILMFSFHKNTRNLIKPFSCNFSYAKTYFVFHHNWWAVDSFNDANKMFIVSLTSWIMQLTTSCCFINKSISYEFT